MTAAHRDLLIAPVVVIAGLVVVGVVVLGERLDTIEARVLRPGNVLALLGQHLVLTATSTTLVLVVAVPLGIALARPRLTRARQVLLAVGAFAQALPPLGVLLLLGFWQFGFRSALIGLTAASLLPVVRNTVVGLAQVDPFVVEAARGMGMSALRTLSLVEIPLATPVIVAGVRVALAQNVNTATLASYIGAGGLGVLIRQALLLNRPTILLVSGALVAAIVLLVDWLAAVAERLIVGGSG